MMVGTEVDEATGIVVVAVEGLRGPMVRRAVKAAGGGRRSR